MRRRTTTDFKLVLDLDSTLIHSSAILKDYENLHLYSDPKMARLRDRVYRLDLVDVVDPPGSGVMTQMWGIFRPHLTEFLTFAVGYFDEVIIWSAGQFKYVHAINDIIFRNVPGRPGRVLTRSDCDETKRNVYKPLRKLDSDLSKYIVLDDREDTFSRNRTNGILIDRYEPNPNYTEIMQEDIALLQLMCWFALPEIYQAHDLRHTEKRHIFSTSLQGYRQKLQQSLDFTPDYCSLAELPLQIPICHQRL
jgi:TFIIF-interacting CTD phosphatase-like protein